MINKDIQKLNRISNYTDRSDCLRLDMNENVPGLPDYFIKNVLEEVDSNLLSTYPNCYNFRLKYSKYLGLQFDNVLPTNGSDMAIRIIFDSYVSKGSKVISVSPSFEMYRINTEMHGAQQIVVRYDKELKIDTNRIIEAIDQDTSLVVLLNPNNPVGNTYSVDDVRRIIKVAERHNCMVLIDEAYHYFSDVSFINLIKEFENVIVIRTFSKLLSIAALRLGVIISSSSNIRLLFNAQPSFDVNSMALLFGEKLIEDKNIITLLIERFRESKQYLYSWLDEKDYHYMPSDGNFVLIEPKNVTPRVLFDKMLDEGVRIKTYEDPLLSSYIRINIPDLDNMKDFLMILGRVDSK